MENYLSELESLLNQQQNYLDRLIQLGLNLENNGQPEHAFRVYKTGLEKAERARSVISGTMLGLLE